MPSLLSVNTASFTKSVLNIETNNKNSANVEHKSTERKVGTPLPRELENPSLAPGLDILMGFKGPAKDNSSLITKIYFLWAYSQRTLITFNTNVIGIRVHMFCIARGSKEPQTDIGLDFYIISLLEPMKAHSISMIKYKLVHKSNQMLTQ